MHPLVFAAAAAAAVYVSAVTVPVSNVTTTTRACRPGYDEFDFCNTSLPVAARVADLIANLRDEEVRGADLACGPLVAIVCIEGRARFATMVTVNQNPARRDGRDIPQRVLVYCGSARGSTCRPLCASLVRPPGRRSRRS